MKQFSTKQIPKTTPGYKVAVCRSKHKSREHVWLINQMLLSHEPTVGTKHPVCCSNNTWQEGVGRISDNLVALL